MSGSMKNMGLDARGAVGHVRKNASTTFKHASAEAPVVRIGVKNGNGPLGKGSMSLDISGACKSLNKQAKGQVSGANGKAR